MDTMIYDNKTGFIPGRCITENIIIFYDIFFETRRLNKPDMFLYINFKKVFAPSVNNILNKLIEHLDLDQISLNG